MNRVVDIVFTLKIIFFDLPKHRIVMYLTMPNRAKRIIDCSTFVSALLKRCTQGGERVRGNKTGTPRKNFKKLVDKNANKWDPPLGKMSKNLPLKFQPVYIRHFVLHQ